MSNLLYNVFITSIVFVFFKVKDYDYYGSYGKENHNNYIYRDLLDKEYTFDYPSHHDIVSHSAKHNR